MDFSNLQLVDENENYICFADEESMLPDGTYLPYLIVNKKFDVIESRVDSLSQAYIFMYQMNNLLVDNNWRKFSGIPDEDEPKETAQLSLFPGGKDDDKVH